MPTKSKRLTIDPDDELKANLVKEADAEDRSLAGQVNRSLRIYYEVKRLLGKGDVAEEVPVVAIVQRLLKYYQEGTSDLDIMTPTRLREAKAGPEEPPVFRTPEVPVAAEQPKSRVSSDPQKS